MTVAKTTPLNALSITQKHSQILRLICDVRNDADLVAAQKEFRLLRDEKIITHGDGAWYDAKSFAVTFPKPEPVASEVKKIAAVVKTAKLNRIQDINFDEFYDYYEKSDLKCKHGIDIMEGNECGFYDPFMDQFGTSEAVVKKLFEKREEIDKKLHAEKLRKQREQQRIAEEVKKNRVNEVIQFTD